MTNQMKTPGAAVIVGRFQVDKLTPGHLDLFNDVIDMHHEKVIVFLGTSPIKASRNNPLPFKARKLLIEEHFKDMTILEIKDVHNEVNWSKTLDEKVREVYPVGPVTCYGSRDGFIKSYHGKFKTIELAPRRVISGSMVRKAIAEGELLSSPEFRAGWIAACFDRYATAYATVDAAIVDRKTQRLLLARKPNDPIGKYRFVGGFVDISQDDSKEESAKREVMEETGLRGVGQPVYVGSAKIDDWRYANENDGILTSLFLIDEFVGEPKASDDISEVKWFDIELLYEGIFVPEHIVLFNLLKAHLQREQNQKENSK